MKRFLQIILGFIAIGIGVAGAWYGRTSYLDSVVTVQLPVPQADIDPYTIITPDLLAWREFPRALVEGQSGFAESPDTLVGKITTSRLVAGLPIPSQLVQVSRDFRLADPTLEVISLPVSPEYAVGGQIQIGEMINIYRIRAWEDDLPIGNAAIISTTVGSQVPQTFTEVELIATVPVVSVLSQDGTAEAAGTETTTEIDKNEAPPVPLQILVVAAPPAIVQDILAAQAASGTGNNQLWITLAIP